MAGLGNATVASVGHVAFGAGREFYRGPDGTLYAAPLDCPLMVNGYRNGGRFECSPRDDGHAAHLRTVWGIELLNKETA